MEALFAERCLKADHSRRAFTSARNVVSKGPPNVEIREIDTLDANAPESEQGGVELNNSSAYSVIGSKRVRALLTHALCANFAYYPFRSTAEHEMLCGNFAYLLDPKS